MIMTGGGCKLQPNRNEYSAWKMRCVANKRPKNRQQFGDGLMIMVQIVVCISGEHYVKQRVAKKKCVGAAKAIV